MEQLEKELAEWESAFDQERTEGGAFEGVVGKIQPLTVLNELRRYRLEYQKASEEASALRQRLAASAAEAAARARDDISLRKELHTARAAGEPSVLQLRQLLIEPAVNREFARLAAATEVAQREAAALKEDMRAIHMVANDPKGPRALATQIRSLEERCEVLVEEAGESRAAQLEKSLALAHGQLEEMRRQYGELEDHVHSVDDETELLQRDLLTARRTAAAAAGGGAGAGPHHPLPGGGPGQQHFGGPPDMMRERERDHHRGHSPGPPPPPHGWGGGGRGRGRGPPPPFFAGRGGGPPPPMLGGGGGKRPRDY